MRRYRETPLSHRAPSYVPLLAILCATLPVSTARAQTAPAPVVVPPATEAASPPATAAPPPPAPPGPPPPPPPPSAPTGTPAPPPQPGYQPQPPPPGYAPTPPTPTAPVEPPPIADTPNHPPKPHARFGELYQVALSAERLFGYTHSWSTWKVDRVNGIASNGLEISTQADNGSFLEHSGQAGLGADLVLDGGVTFGGALSYAGSGGQQTVNPGTTAGVLVGPTCDLGFSGAGTTGSNGATIQEGKLTGASAGVAAGLMGYLGIL
jgi:hypothetical protein